MTPADVRKLSGGSDYATDFPSRGGRVVLLAAFTISIALAGGACAQGRAEDMWQNISGCTDIVDVEMFIAAFPESPFVEDARACLTTLGDSRAGTSFGGKVTTQSQAGTPTALEASLNLTLDQRVLIQHGLVHLGYDISILDGIIGSRTRQGIASHQQAKGLPSTGYLTSGQSEALMALGRARDDLTWLDAETTDTSAAYRSYLSEFPRGVHTAEARSRLAGRDGAVEVRSDALAESREAVRTAEAARDLAQQATGLIREELRRALEALSEAEKARLAEAAAAEALRRRLANSEDELTAMSLALEEERKKAEETLAMLVAADSAAEDARAEASVARTELARLEEQFSLTSALYREELSVSEERRQSVALLNRQILELREQLNELQGLLDTAAAKDVEAQVEIASLGENLNQALARAAAEQKRRADLEERERRRLEEEARDLRRFHSEFLAQLQDVLGSREGVSIVGDRFVFSSETLFEVGSDLLGDTGKDEIRRVAEIIKDVAGMIPPEVDWLLRVDGHTDKTPVRANDLFRDNWELSQARALSVVHYMIDELGIPADRLAATGFGEHRPISAGDDPQSLARNRRVELKFTER